MGRQKQQVTFNHLFLFLGFSLVQNACTPAQVSALKSASSITNASNSIVSSTLGTGNVRAFRIIMQAGPGGSFSNQPSTVGTAPGLGNGFRADRYFDISNSGVALSTKPSWLDYIEVGLSGSANSNGTGMSTPVDCARFDDFNSHSNSYTDTSPTQYQLRNGQNYFRVSEFDCIDTSSTTKGTGSVTNDPIYIRAKFLRSVLGSSENILMTIDYTAQGLPTQNAASPQDPNACISGTSTTPESCADQSWKTFIFNSSSLPTIPSPFTTFIPPFQAFNASLANLVLAGNLANTPALLGQAGVMTKQIVLPLSTNANLDLMHLTRTGSRIPTANKSHLSNATTGACPNVDQITGGSPFCLGVVFYTLTFYRI